MFTTREVATVAVLSAAGGALSVPLGYAGNMINAVPGVPFGSPQLLAGIHVLWMVLAGLVTRRFGAAAATGALKGLVELSLFSFHGPLVLPIAIAEGLATEACLLVLGRRAGTPAYITGGFGAAANVLVLRMLVLGALPWGLIALMVVFAFASGAFFSGYVGGKALLAILPLLR